MQRSAKIKIVLLKIAHMLTVMLSTSITFRNSRPGSAHFTHLPFICVHTASTVRLLTTIQKLGFDCYIYNPITMIFTNTPIKLSLVLTPMSMIASLVITGITLRTDVECVLTRSTFLKTVLFGLNPPRFWAKINQDAKRATNVSSVMVGKSLTIIQIYTKPASVLKA